MQTLRPEIELSWKRSQLSGINPARVPEPTLLDPSDSAGRLLRAARPVLDDGGEDGPLLRRLLHDAPDHLLHHLRVHLVVEVGDPFLALGVVTDSGGISEETTALGVPCITLREETERPETVSLGTNLLVGNEASKIRDAISQLKRGNWKKGSIPPKWDGQTAQRIIRILLEHEPMIMDRLG